MDSELRLARRAHLEAQDDDRAAMSYFNQLEHAMRFNRLDREQLRDLTRLSIRFKRGYLLIVNDRFTSAEGGVEAVAWLEGGVQVVETEDSAVPVDGLVKTDHVVRVASLEDAIRWNSDNQEFGCAVVHDLATGLTFRTYTKNDVDLREAVEGEVCPSCMTWQSESTDPDNPAHRPYKICPSCRGKKILTAEVWKDEESSP